MASDKLFTVQMFLMGLLVMAALDFTDAQIGVCYGRLGNNLPPASEVITLYRQNSIRRMRLYDPDRSTLQALGGSNIELMLGVPNDALQYVAASQDNARNWVQTNVLNFPGVNFKYIAVGNEVSPFRNSGLMPFLLPALRNIQTAISQAGKGNQIKVSTAIETAVTTNTYPPSKGEFRPEVRDYLRQIVDILKSNNAPLLVNLYTYFAHKDNNQISLNYALFREGTNTPDGPYPSLFAAILDATYSALEKVGGGSLRIVVSESGWPSAGGKAASVDNARTYNSMLIQNVKRGTPKRSGAIEAYIFAMFNENRKDGEETERNFGLFFPDKRPKYQINFN